MENYDLQSRYSISSSISLDRYAQFNISNPKSFSTQNFNFSHFSVIFFSILLFVLTIFIYAKFKELRDFHGKTIISFLVNLIFAYGIVPFLVFKVPDKKTDSNSMEIILSSFIIAMVHILLWITAMIVNSFLKFK